MRLTRRRGFILYKSQLLKELRWPDRYFQHTFPNGLTLLAEKMPGMQSAAMTLLLPAGVGTDPVDRTGSATVLSDLVLRGAGSARQPGS